MVELNSQCRTADECPFFDALESGYSFDNCFGMFGYTSHAVNFERWRVIIAFKYRSG